VEVARRALLSRATPSLLCHVSGPTPLFKRERERKKYFPLGLDETVEVARRASEGVGREKNFCGAPGF
jgi:hypothetical protein